MISSLDMHKMFRRFSKISKLDFLRYEGNSVTFKSDYFKFHFKLLSLNPTENNLRISLRKIESFIESTDKAESKFKRLKVLFDIPLHLLDENISYMYEPLISNNNMEQLTYILKYNDKINYYEKESILNNRIFQAVKHSNSLKNFILNEPLTVSDVMVFEKFNLIYSKEKMEWIIKVDENIPKIRDSVFRIVEESKMYGKSNIYNYIENIIKNIQYFICLLNDTQIEYSSEFKKIKKTLEQENTDDTFVKLNLWTGNFEYIFD